MQIIEKLVDVVCYIRQSIVEVFGNNGNNSFYLWSSDDDPTSVKSWIKDSEPTIGLKANEGKQGRERLGEAGLSLHYANLIQQIDSIVSFHLLMQSCYDIKKGFVFL